MTADQAIEIVSAEAYDRKGQYHTPLTTAICICLVYLLRKAGATP